MSFRHTFITNYIYIAGLENHDEIIENIKNCFPADFVEWRGHDGYGYFHGVMKSLSPDEYFDNGWLKELVYELRKATVLPFTIVFLFEDNPVVTYQIEPLTK